MRTRHILIALVVIAVATLHLVERHHHQAEMERVRADLAALSGTVESSRRSDSVDDSTRQLFARMVTAKAQEKPTTATTPSAIKPAVEGEKPSQVEPADPREHFEDSFLREGVDSNWSGKAQLAAQSKLASVIPQTSSLRSVECRTSMCRIEVMHEDRDHFRQFLDKTIQDPQGLPWNGASFSSIFDEMSDGKLVTVSFLAREGQELPRM